MIICISGFIIGGRYFIVFILFVFTIIILLIFLVYIEIDIFSLFFTDMFYYILIFLF